MNKVDTITPMPTVTSSPKRVMSWRSMPTADRTGARVPGTLRRRGSRSYWDSAAPAGTSFTTWTRSGYLKSHDVAKSTESSEWWVWTFLDDTGVLPSLLPLCGKEILGKELNKEGLKLSRPLCPPSSALTDAKAFHDLHVLGACAFL
jgi:hypothetical protein